MTILILGNETEDHARFIFDKLTQKGASPVYLDTMAFPLTSRLSFEPGIPLKGFFKPDAQTQAIPFEAIQSVYWRTFNGIQTSHITDPFLQNTAYREIDSALGSWMRNMTTEALWVNPPEAIELHRYKGHQLQLMKTLGLRIPETVFTNDPDTVLEFYERMHQNVIYKPVLGGAHTQKIKPEDLAPERLSELKDAPVQFQELIPGVDIRVYKVGEALFAAEIQSETLDFRDHPGAPIVPVDLPDDIAQQCLEMAEVFQLVLSGIDLRRTPDGEYVFIEANPSPMFQYFESVSGFPISDTLINLLINRVA
jgi:hypothetical protein